MVKLKSAFLCLATVTGGVLFSNAQNSKINLSTQNNNLKDVIKEIEKQTDYLFVYNSNEIDLNQKSSVKIQDAPVETALATVFNNNNIDYRIQGNNIMLVQASSHSTQQAEKKITGTVVDEKGEALIGVTVGVKGTSVGSMTDLDGNFTISAAPGSSLVISYLGYNNQEVPVTAASTYKITMSPASIEIPDVVVTALGIKREKKALSYNAQEIKQDELTTVKDANFINALNGKVAGVTINSSSSGVGGASKVVMRGSKSIGQSNNAMYVIDGIPMFNIGAEGGTEFDSQGGSEAAADINPEDIESLTVLNGAAASALYGSNAANGVILITTKKGKAGKTSVTFTQNTEFIKPFVLPKFQNSYGTGTGGVNSNSTDYSWGAKLNDSNRYGYDPGSDYFQTGHITTETLSLSTGNDINQTYASVAAVNSEGYIPNNTYDRLNFSIRNSTSMLNDKLKMDLGASYIKQKDNNMTNQGIYQNPLVSAYLFPRGGDWNDVKMYEQWDTSRKISTQRWDYGLDNYTGQNPYWINYRNLRSNTKDRYTMNISLAYQVLDWLNIAGRARTDFSETKFQEKLYATTNTTLTDGSSTGLYGIRTTRDRQSYADILASMNKNFLGGDLTFNATVGASISDVTQDYIQVRGALTDGTYEGAIPNVFTVYQMDRDKMKMEQQKYHDQTQSIFASAELGYKNTYYLTLTGRNDWPSQLAGAQSSSTSFFYPSVGGSVILSEIIDMPKLWNYLKLRGSYASVGSPFDRFIAQRYHAPSGSGIGYNPNYEFFPLSSFKPQRTNSWEVGITTKFLNGFNLDVSLYTAETFNQVIKIDLPSTTGYNYTYVQSGSVTNKGIEVSLGYERTFGKVNWSSTYVLTANKNKINKLFDNTVNPATGEIITDEYISVKAVGDTEFRYKEGGTLGDLYSLTDLARDENGSIYVDANGNVSKVNVADNPVKLGSVLPKANMSWRNDFRWNNFNFGFMFSARLGGIVYSATQAMLDSQGVSEASEIARDNGGVVINGGDVVDAQNWYQTIGTSSNIAQYYTYSATNVRLQEVSLGYTFPKSRLWNIGDLTVSFVGKNLLMIYNKAPFDPESVASTGNNYQGVDYFMMPSNRSLGFNVRMRF